MNLGLAQQYIRPSLVQSALWQELASSVRRIAPAVLANIFICSCDFSCFSDEDLRCLRPKQISSPWTWSHTGSHCRTWFSQISSFWCSTKACPRFFLSLYRDTDVLVPVCIFEWFLAGILSQLFNSGHHVCHPRVRVWYRFDSTDNLGESETTESRESSHEGPIFHISLSCLGARYVCTTNDISHSHWMMQECYIFG